MPGTCFGALPFQRKGVKKHLESQAHQRAIHAAAEAREEELATRIKVRRLDTEVLEAEAKRFASSLSGELPTNCSSVPHVLVNRNETLREREMWERFEMDGIECAESFAGHDDANEEDAIDTALKCLHAINLGAVGPADSSPFYDDGDETITNIMRKIGNVPTRYLRPPSILRMIVGPRDDDTKQSFQASANAPSSTANPEWFPYPSKTVRLFPYCHTLTFGSSIPHPRCSCWMHLIASHSSAFPTPS